ncbi:hypothetical protein ACFL0W_03850 [Nanoarchaeota archaeon]
MIFIATAILHLGSSATTLESSQSGSSQIVPSCFGLSASKHPHLILLPEPSFVPAPSRVSWICTF